MVWAWNATNQSGKTRSFNSQKRLVRRRVSKTLTNACRTVQVTRNGFRCLTKSLLTRYHVLRHLKLTKSFRLEFASNVWRKGDELLAVCVSPCWGYATWSSIDLLNDVLRIREKITKLYWSWLILIFSSPFMNLVMRTYVRIAIFLCF